MRAFLVAQSLNQIDKAYGANHAILDNCHVRVAFAPNDERTAKRLSDALGTATELRAHKNLSGRRLLGLAVAHLRCRSRRRRAPLLTAGEILQLPPTRRWSWSLACRRSAPASSSTTPTAISCDRRLPAPALAAERYRRCAAAATARLVGQPRAHPDPRLETTLVGSRAAEHRTRSRQRAARIAQRRERSTGRSAL